MPADGMLAAAQRKDFGTSGEAALPSGYLNVGAMRKGEMFAHSRTS